MVKPKLDEMIKVICFYWQGDRWQENGYSDPKGHENDQQAFMDKAGKYDVQLVSRYVNNLYKGVKRFADRPFEFICFTNQRLDVKKGVQLRSFPLHTRMGVLPRLYMFSREAGLFGDQVLCLDLDIVITGSLKSIMDYTGIFCARSKFKQGEQYKLDGDIMSFQAGPMSEAQFWFPFISNVKAAEELTQGRERYWMRHVAGTSADRWEQFAPNQILSYKRHMKGRTTVPEGTAIVSCHGNPRPHEISNNWINKYWK